MNFRTTLSLVNYLKEDSNVFAFMDVEKIRPKDYDLSNSLIQVTNAKLVECNGGILVEGLYNKRIIHVHPDNISHSFETVFSQYIEGQKALYNQRASAVIRANTSQEYWENNVTKYFIK